MTKTTQKIDMKALNTITDQVLGHKPPQGSPSQRLAKTVDTKEPTPKLSHSNSTTNVNGEDSRNARRD